MTPFAKTTNHLVWLSLALLVAAAALPGCSSGYGASGATGAADAGGMNDGGGVGSGGDAAGPDDAAQGGGADATAAEDAGPPAPSLTWFACPPGKYQTAGGLGGFGGAQELENVECAQVQVPLDRAVPEKGNVLAHVARVPAKEQRRGSLWLLQGGPGGSGWDLAPLADAFAKAVPDLDIYLPDHRGTGFSTPLSCPQFENQGAFGGGTSPAAWTGCLASVQDEWGGGVVHFNSTAAAEDLHVLIEAAREPGDTVFVYGVSYGTYWLNRLLQLHPDAADGVIFDSICPPGACLGDDYDTAYDAVARDYFELCAKDPVCGGKLGADPAAVLEGVYEKMGNGHCPEINAIMPPQALRQVFSMMLQQVQFRPAIPPLVYRLDRCDPGDVQVLQRVAQLLGAFGGGFMPPASGAWAPESLQFSIVLNSHILFSEMWSDPAPPAAQILQSFSETIIAPGATQSSILLFNQWPRYPHDEWVGGFAKTDAKVLMLNGTLDPQTPPWYAQVLAEQMQGPNAELVLFEGGAHGTTQQSPTIFGTNCGMELSTQFVSNLNVPLDKGCVDALVPVSFSVPAQYVQFIFGTTDAWENPKSDFVPPPLDAAHWPEGLPRLEALPKLPRW